METWSKIPPSYGLTEKRFRVPMFRWSLGGPKGGMPAEKLGKLEPILSLVCMIEYVHIIM